MAENLLFGLTLIFVLGLVAHWTAWRLHLPAILLLLLTGIIAGPITGILNPDAIFGDLLIPLVSLSVAVILFEGGLSLSLSDLREIGSIVRNLVTVGVLVTWVLASAAAFYILNFDIVLAILLGAILVVTGPTVIIPMLRHVRPRGKIGNIVKWEGILNDPIGALLAVLVYEAILAGGFYGSPRGVVTQFFYSIAVASLVGLAGAAIMAVVLKYHWVPDFLDNTFSLTMVISVFTASNTFQAESGLLATTVMGVALANQRVSPVAHIVEFKEHLRVLMISGIFIILSSRLNFSDLKLIGLSGFVFLAVLMVVVRPSAVAASTLGSQISPQERRFLWWMAPRGIVAAAVASIFAERLTEIGHANAERLLPITFLVIIGTATIYGLGAFPVARRLGLAEANPQGALIVGAHSWARSIASALKDEEVHVVLVDSNRANIKAARLEGLSAHYGGILSEQVLDEIDLYGLSRLLALTSNDEANSLAALHFADVFGRAEVYQLSPGDIESSGRKSTTLRHLTGRFLFAEDATFNRLSRLFASGSTVKATRITKQFNYKAFLEMYGESVVPLFVITDEGRLTVVTAASAPKPRPGQTIVAVVTDDEVPKEKSARRETPAQVGSRTS